MNSKTVILILSLIGGASVGGAVLGVCFAWLAKQGADTSVATADAGELAEPEDEPSEGFTAPTLAQAELAVFHVTKTKMPAAEALKVATEGTGYTVSPKSPGPREKRSVRLTNSSTTDYEVFQGEAIEHARGLSALDKKALPGAKRVSILRFEGPPTPESWRAFATITVAFAEATGGVLWDEEAREYLSLSAFRERRLESWEGALPHAMRNISVLTGETKDGLVRLTTSGLKHFGLAELRLESIPRSSNDSALSLINALSQRLVEEPAAAKPGTGRLALDTLRHRAHRQALLEACVDGARKAVDYRLSPLENDDGPTLLLVDFPGSGEGPEQVEAAIHALFGSADKVDHIEHDDKMKALSKHQLEIFDRVWVPRFKRGLRSGEVLLVKAPFTTTAGGNEWMWVEITRMNRDGTIDGLLSNDPDDVPALHSGSKVTVKRADLFDWTFTDSDGSHQGNETGELMRQQLDRGQQ